MGNAEISRISRMALVRAKNRPIALLCTCKFPRRYMSRAYREEIARDSAEKNGD